MQQIGRITIELPCENGEYLCPVEARENGFDFNMGITINN